MNIGFAAPGFLWLLTALPLVVLLHYLRTRRKRQDVAAMFLWQRAQQAVIRRRRFSPTSLLAVQLAFTALAAVALARPYIGAPEPPPRAVIIDASASMAAASGPTTRIEEAAGIARRLTAGAARVALIRAGLEATLMAPIDADVGLRAAALNELWAGDVSADVSGALELATALLPGAEVHVISDQELHLGQATLHQVGAPVVNAGISALDIGIGYVFVGVVGSGGRPLEVPVTLSQDGVDLASATVLVPAQGAGTVTFPLGELGGVVEARLTAPAGDALALDDVAYAGAKPVTVVSDLNYGPLVRALAALPNAEASYSVGARFLAADLRVLQQADAGELLPGAHLLFPPPVEQPRFATVRDWNRAHELMRFVDLRDLLVGLGPVATAWVDEPGWEVLARTAELEPVLRARQSDGAWQVQAAFHPSQSDLVLRSAFPTLIANLAAAVETTVRLRLGEALPGAPVAVPEGAVGQSAVGPAVAGVPGVYRIAGQVGGVAGETLALASLLSAAESRLEATPRIAALGPTAGGSAAPSQATGAQSTAAAAAIEDSAPSNGARAADSPPSRLALALLALAVLALLLEWLLYSGLPRRTVLGARSG